MNDTDNWSFDEIIELLFAAANEDKKILQNWYEARSTVLFVEMAHVRYLHLRRKLREFLMDVGAEE